MFQAKFQGLSVVPAKAAQRELTDLGLNIWQGVEVLERGFNCSRSRRKHDKIERCLKIGNKIVRVVGAYNYNIVMKEEMLVIIHVSVEGLKWLKLQK